jgi:hypothetical protein
MNEQVQDFVIRFFENLKCEVYFEEDILIVKEVPRSFEDIYGVKGPYEFSFKDVSGQIAFAGRGSKVLAAINTYLEGGGKTTLLKIDFDVDPIKEIEKAISLKNCKIDNISKKHTNKFFSRFTFISLFHYLNEIDQILKEIYVHNEKIVEGNLEGYNVIEGLGSEARTNSMDKDYEVARTILKESVNEKTEEISKLLEVKAREEVSRVREHYSSLTGELGGDLNEKLRKIEELEEKLKYAEEKEYNLLKNRIERTKKDLIKIGDNEARERILKEQEFTIKDVMQKHSLNIDTKLINTTLIYYPVFSFNLFLKGDGSGRFVEMSYDPLTKSLDSLSCDSCNKKISNINLCSGGHISCDECMSRCSACADQFCMNCLKKSCICCGDLLCKTCAKMCLSCGKYVCKNHIRKDSVSGEERCVQCLRACLRCHGMSNPKYFGEAIDGSKVCQKCLGKEKQKGVMKAIFQE